MECFQKAEAEALVTSDQCSKIDSDGSTRKFWRLTKNGGPFCLIAAPAGTSPTELAESRSAWKIGRHLFQQGVPVPELYGWDSSTGVLLFEDLGDIRLHDIVVKKNKVQTPPDESIAHLLPGSPGTACRHAMPGSRGF